MQLSIRGISIDQLSFTMYVKGRPKFQKEAYFFAGRSELLT
jgi:hypothetical protein